MPAEEVPETKTSLRNWFQKHGNKRPGSGEGSLNSLGRFSRRSQRKGSRVIAPMIPTDVSTNTRTHRSRYRPQDDDKYLEKSWTQINKLVHMPNEISNGDEDRQSSVTSRGDVSIERSLASTITFGDEMESTSTSNFNQSFENFIQKQRTIIEESKALGNLGSNAGKEEINDDDELPFIQRIESIISSASSMEEETQAVNVKSMVDVFEIRSKEQLPSSSSRNKTDHEAPPQMLFNLLEDKENEIEAHTNRGSTPLHSSNNHVTEQQTSKPTMPPKDCNDELKIIFVGSPQSGKTSLIQSLTGTCEEEEVTSASGGGRPRTFSNNSTLTRRRRQSQQYGNNGSDAGERKVVGNTHVKSWTPISTGEYKRSIRFNLWDLPGARWESGSHPSTQSIFFTPNSLYIIVWDMSANNPHAMTMSSNSRSSRTLDTACSSEEGSYSFEEYDSFEDEYDDDSSEHGKSRKRQEEIINKDIDDNVLFWIDSISKQFPHDCAFLPVLTHRDKFDNAEIEHRTAMLKERLGKMPSANIFFDSRGKIPKVTCLEDRGSSELHKAILDITSSYPLFEGNALKKHLETRIPPVTVIVKKVVTQLKAKGRTIQHIYDIQQEVCAEFARNPPRSVDVFGLPQIADALRFLSCTGSILYFARDDCGKYVDDNILSHIIILDPRWITTAFSSILRRDLRRKLRELKQERSISFVSKGASVEYHESFQKRTSECAVVSREDTALLWDSRNSIKKARETFYSNYGFALYHYLRQLFENYGVFVPLTTSSKGNSPTFYLLPSLFKKVPEEYWRFKPSQNHQTTLCQSWVFNDGVPNGLFDLVNIAVLESLFHKHALMTDEISYHAKVDEIRCWKNAFFVRIVEYFSEQNSRRSSNIIKIYVHIVDRDSPQCVDSGEMVFGEKKLIVSATGNTGNDGETIWSLGYDEAIESVKRVIEELTTVVEIEREVACPDCLRYHEAKDACTVGYESLDPDQYEPPICSRGHRLNTNLLLGPRNAFEGESTSVSTGAFTFSSMSTSSSLFEGPEMKNVEELLGSIVLVGLWDKDTQEIKNLGSGFIADRKRGLAVTASHIFYDNPVGKAAGPVYYGLQNGKAVIGVIPKSSVEDENFGAIFTYCADIIADDVNKTDACILRITSKFKNPVKADGIKLKIQPEILLSQKDIIRQSLKRLRCKGCSLEEYVRVLGFNQEGEGLAEKGEYVEQMPCVTKGYVSKKLSSHRCPGAEGFMPTSEIVVMCSTISGHSGGPCVNANGEVIGIVSRADPIEKDRCYLVPAKQIKLLLNKAKIRFDTGGNYELMNAY